MSFEPIVGGSASSSSKFIYGNKPNVAVVTLWTKSKDVAGKLDSSKYGVMGQLFSAERGLDLMVRNLLANPQITNLVITGIDFSHSGKVLKDFFDKGFRKGTTDIGEKPVWRVNSDYPGYINLDIPEEDLINLKNSIRVDWAPNIDNFDFSSLQSPGKMRERKTFPKKEEKYENRYIAEDIGFVVKGKKIAEVWLKILDNILKFGKFDDTHYEQKQKEILNLISVISEEDPDNWHLPDYLPFDKTHVMQYIPQITTSAKVPGTSYTYGMRMREWFGNDQVKGAIEKLAKKRVSRAVVINLWDSTQDLTIGGSPCVNHIWLRIRDNRLFMTTTIRSNDMFEAYPDNCFGLRALQDLIRKELNARFREKGEKEIELGDLIVNSQSAHIYEDCWEKAQAILDKELDRVIAGPANAFMNPDPRGNFVISIEDSAIKVEHVSAGGELMGEYKGRNAKELIDKISKANVISMMGHALDIGLELARAEVCMQLGIEYLQESIMMDFDGYELKKKSIETTNKEPVHSNPPEPVHSNPPEPVQSNPVQSNPAEPVQPTPEPEIRNRFLELTSAPTRTQTDPVLEMMKRKPEPTPQQLFKKSVKEGILQTTEQEKDYPRVLKLARIDSFGV